MERMKKYSLREPLLADEASNLKEHTELIQQLLFHRGIKTSEDRQAFLNPDYERDLHDPYLMRDMERACVRIFEAIEAEEKIVIYADYDCDGIPGAIFRTILRPRRLRPGLGVDSAACADDARDEVVASLEPETMSWQGPLLPSSTRMRAAFSRSTA